MIPPCMLCLHSDMTNAIVGLGSSGPTMAVDVGAFEADVMDVDQMMDEAMDTNGTCESCSIGRMKKIGRLRMLTASTRSPGSMAWSMRR